MFIVNDGQKIGSNADPVMTNTVLRSFFTHNYAQWEGFLEHVVDINEVLPAFQLMADISPRRFLSFQHPYNGDAGCVGWLLDRAIASTGYVPQYLDVYKSISYDSEHICWLFREFKMFLSQSRDNAIPFIHIKNWIDFMADVSKKENVRFSDRINVIDLFLIIKPLQEEVLGNEKKEEEYEKILISIVEDHYLDSNDIRVFKHCIDRQIERIVHLLHHEKSKVCFFNLILQHIASFVVREEKCQSVYDLYTYHLKMMISNYLVETLKEETYPGRELAQRIAVEVKKTAAELQNLFITAIYHERDDEIVSTQKPLLKRKGLSAAAEYIWLYTKPNFTIGDYSFFVKERDFFMEEFKHNVTFQQMCTDEQKFVLQYFYAPQPQCYGIIFSSNFQMKFNPHDITINIDFNTKSGTYMLSK